ncbi:putative protein BTR1 [Cocos nucifera]|uniref:K Homology domain-containing protein n=1 Tax=Cocos nucifera TaxID=13894 RepID=A0A8K0N8K7_COCNU|nr:putative protein BTR1 [Cocos nucifera]
MESLDTPAISSPEAPPARPRLRPKTPSPDGRETQTYIRFLVSNIAAGCIIGKGGSTITELQSQSGARIQLSRNHEFYPGTTDRIIMVSGATNEIIKAMELILEKLLTEAEESNDAESKSKVRLIVPHSSCGGIIGKAGSTIKSFVEDSGAGIKISPQDNNHVGLNDRLATITGSLEEQIRAIFLILSRLTEDTHYSQSIITPYPYAELTGIMHHTVPYPHGVSFDLENCEKIQGCTTFGAALVSGARIKVSDRGDFISGTFDRKVTITGSWGAINAAESMIMHKISSISARSFVEDSGAGIKISPQDNNHVGLNDRLATITGSLEEQIRAIFLILSRLTEDTHYSQSIITPYPYAGINFAGAHGIPIGYVIPSVASNPLGGMNGYGGKYPNSKVMTSPVVSTRLSAGTSEGRGNSLMIGVADEHIGAVVGRGGRNIMEISQVSGARIKVSDRGDFISGTFDRKVIITGSWGAINAAESMIMHKISSISARNDNVYAVEG